MELSGEDSLRLNVLLAKPLCAIRMDEARMTVHALNHQRSPMQLNIIIDDATVPVTVPDTLIAAAADFFGRQGVPRTSYAEDRNESPASRHRSRRPVH